MPRHSRNFPFPIRAALSTALVIILGCGETTQQPDPRDTGPVFVDVAAKAGINYTHFNGMSGELFYCEMMGPGASFFDYDNDGDLDLYVTQGRMLGPGKTLEDALIPPPADMPLSDRLYRNDLQGMTGGQPQLHFTDVTALSGLHATGYGMGVIAGDIDNDGFQDLYVTNFGDNQLWHNNGDGTFSDVTEFSGTNDDRWSVSAAFMDYDRDGWLDLYVVNYTDFRFANREPCFGVSGEPDYCGPMSHTPETDRLFRNRHDGTFENVTGPSGILEPGPGLGVVSADFDNDGWLDIYVANDQAQNFLWMNHGDGRFSNEAMLRGSALNCAGKAQASMGVVAGDIDGDGDDDLYMTHLLNEVNTLYLNDGTGLFLDMTSSAGLASPSMGLTGFGAALLDVDNDGNLDLVAANGEVRILPAQRAAGDPLPLRQSNSLLLNKGGRFEDASDRAPVLAKPFVSRSAVVGDVDNDGDADVLITNNNDPLQLLLNQIGSDAHWLGVRVVGQTGRDMLGTKVALIRRNRPPLWRWARTDSSYLASNDPRVIFGLGDDSEIVRVDVRWPDGQTESFSGLEIEKYNTLIQGGGGRILIPEDAEITIKQAERTGRATLEVEAPKVQVAGLHPLPAVAEIGDTERGVRRQFLDRHAAVLRLLNDGRANDEGLSWAFGQLGRVYHAYQKMEPARSCYSNAITLDPREFRWLYLLAHVDRAEGRFAASNAGLEKALKLRPGDIPSLVFMGENYADLQLLDQAESRFEAALSLDRDCAKAHLGLARTALQRNLPEQALVHLEQAFILQPEASQVHFALGMAHRALGDSKAAQAFFDMVPNDTLAKVSITLEDPLMQETADLRKSAQIQARMGNKALSQGRYPMAVRYFRHAVAIDPDRSDVRYNLAGALVRLGQYPPAQEHLEELLLRSPDHALGHILMARILERNGDFDEADNHLQLVLAADPALEGVRLTMGDFALERNRPAEAVKHYSRAQEISPEVEEASIGIVISSIRLGKFQDAVDELNELLALRPDNVTVNLLLARILAASPDAGFRDGLRAVALVEPIVERHPTVLAAETMAMAMAEVERFDQATRWQNAALETFRSGGVSEERVRTRLGLYQKGLPCRQPWVAFERHNDRPIRPPTP